MADTTASRQREMPLANDLYNIDSLLSEEERLIRDTVRKFVQERVLPIIGEHFEEGTFPHQLIPELAHLGLLGMHLHGYDCAGLSAVAYGLVCQELEAGDSGLRSFVSVQGSLAMFPIWKYGSEEQKQYWLPKMAAGEVIGCFGLTEPEAGSDSGGTMTSARLQGEMWHINGSKAFITNAGTDITGGVTITAVTGRRSDGHKEITNMIVPRHTPGYLIGPAYKKMGWRASDTRPLTFEDCMIPEADVLGQRNNGFKQFMSILDAGRIAIAALSVGLAQACLDEALSYAQTRQQFGQPIGKFQAIQFKLADMDMEIELARLMYYKAAWLMMQGKSYTREASIAKLFASETAKRAADQAVQIHGGYGFMDEYAVSRYWRNVKVNEIGEGTSEVQRILISKQLMRQV